MASRYPAGRWKPLGTQTENPMARHDIICAHTAVTRDLAGLFGYFQQGGYDGVESHFGVGGKWGSDPASGLDGVVEQYQDIGRRADANLEGNHRVISIETTDNAARPIEPWTPAQISALIRLIAWLCSPAAHAGCPADWRCHQVGIPPVLVPDTQSTRRGLGYHAQGAAEHTVGEWWSTTPSKDCPTSVRISQFKNTVIPGVVATLAGQPTQEVPLMALTEAEQDELLANSRKILAQFDPANTSGVINKLNRTGVAVQEVKAALTAGIADDAERDARVLGRLDSLSLPSFTAEQVAELAAALDLDEAKVADAVRRDLAEALSGPAA